MKLITRDTDYAIRALFCIAKKKKEKVSVSELVSELRIPKPFLRKIFQILSKKGILKSYKGKNGGFELVQDPKKISLLDIIEVFQGKLQLNDCMFKKVRCPNMKVCEVKKRIDKIQDYVLNELKDVTIDSFIKEELNLC